MSYCFVSDSTYVSLSVNEILGRRPNQRFSLSTCQINLKKKDFSRHIILCLCTTCEKKVIDLNCRLDPKVDANITAISNIWTTSGDLKNSGLNTSNWILQKKTMLGRQTKGGVKWAMLTMFKVNLRGVHR